jgi:hypothetical protein
MNLRLQITALFYLVSITVVLYTKPSLFYDNDKNIKHFGTGKDKTILPIYLAIILLAVLSFYLGHAIMLLI